MKIRVIIPCYNEAKRLDVSSFINFLEEGENNSIHLLFVNDGSSDDTIRVINELKGKYRTVEVLDLKKNVGKAEAIRAGINSSHQNGYDFLGYLDADLATPLEEMHRLRNLAEEKNPYIILGARIKILGVTNIQRERSRHYIGRVFATVVSNMLKLPIYDTQCGAKLIRKDIAQVIFKESFVSKWLFDVELLFRIKQHFKPIEDKVVEMPLNEWRDVAGSKISSSYFLKAPIDLLKIYMKYK